MSHDDIATRCLRVLTRAWGLLLQRKEQEAIDDLGRVIEAMEQQMTFTRCHPDVLDVVAEAARYAKQTFEGRGGHLPAADRLVDRVHSLQLRAIGRPR